MSKGKRAVDTIVVHHSASGSAVTTVEKIDQWHKQRGWSEIGYHFVVYPNGSIHKGRNINKTGAHCKNHNTGSIGICVVGNFEVEPVTEPQKFGIEGTLGLFGKIEELLIEYNLTWNDVYGHRDLGNSTCPGESLYKALVEHKQKILAQS
jgi:N-acetyl-anhydromuramyl-L-alanine amidase AmpD